MTRRRILVPPGEELFERLRQRGRGAPSLAEKLQMIQGARGQSEELDRRLDEFLLVLLDRALGSLDQSREALQEARFELDRLTGPPSFLGIYLGPAPGSDLPAAVVWHGGGERVVSLAEGLDPDGLSLGDRVVLAHELNVILRRAEAGPVEGGETAVFERRVGEERIVVRARDEEFVARAAAPLQGEELEAGDLVRWDRSGWIAFEKIERSRGESLFLEETPVERWEQIGGLEEQVALIQRTVLLHLEHGETAARYGLRRRGGILLSGPPGTGKTLMARALANWLARLSSLGRSRFINVKPGGLHSMWYAQSEANYREAFRSAKEAAEDEPGVPVCMFFDEIDSVGSSRSASLSRVDDRVLPAFMAELDGLEGRGNVLVVAATNRADALDPALLRPGRLGDAIVEVPRPRRDAAREIFGKHLAGSVPLAEEGPEPPEGRREALVESVLGSIFDPNGAGELAELTFRDGRRRSVTPRDLVSGASIQKIVQDATERACLREIESGAVGLRLGDLLDASEEEFARCAALLVPLNCHRHISDLPQDVDVVNVERPRRPLRRRHSYLRSA
jgi:proteasome-associated ATPase